MNGVTRRSIVAGGMVSLFAAALGLSRQSSTSMAATSPAHADACILSGGEPSAQTLAQADVALHRVRLNLAQHGLLPHTGEDAASFHTRMIDVYTRAYGGDTGELEEGWEFILDEGGATYPPTQSCIYCESWKFGIFRDALSAYPLDGSRRLADLDPETREFVLMAHTLYPDYLGMPYPTHMQRTNLNARLQDDLNKVEQARTPRYEYPMCRNRTGDQIADNVTVLVRNGPSF